MDKTLDVHKLFDDKSEIYAQARPRYPADLYQWIENVCPGHHSVWDVGCGNGQAGIDLSHYFEEVQATDVSASQIANAPNCERVRFSVQPAESTNFGNSSFDAVCVAQALHWFDYERFWPEVIRVLKQNGVFAAWGYSWPHVDTAIDEALEQSFMSAIRPYWASQNKLLWDGYKDVPFPLAPLEVPTIELNMNWSVEIFFTYLHSWSATRRCMEVEGNEFFEESYQRVKDVWGSEGERIVSMDFVAIAGKKVA
jgi:SAM-dependent methyltransferase